LGIGQSIAAQQAGSIDDLKQVLASFERELATLNAEGPYSQLSWRAELRTTHTHLSYAYQALGDRTGDVSYYQHALEEALQANAMSRDLAAGDPSLENQRNVFDGLADIGIFRWKCCRDLESAVRDEKQALEGFTRIAERDLQNVEAQRDVANAHQYMGIIYAFAGRRSDALHEDREALAIYQRLASIDPDSGENANYLADMRARIASIEQAK
jgi:tetratricopeptide (TPR) repeat protein